MRTVQQRFGRLGRRVRSDRGSASLIAGPILIVLIMLGFVAAMNVVTVQYTRGMVRTALDEGARAGAVDTAACIQRIETYAEPLAGLAEFDYSCTVEGEQATATGTASVASWLPLVPSVTVDETATAPRFDIEG